jgi:2-succinyl-5-enolpyruvyl-6-hydroxy-3-cyclohexene-1-carboxylate synthase
VAEIRSEEAAGETGAKGGTETALLNLAWAERLVESLARSGVRDAVVCAGSRSAPLALAVDRSPLRAHVALDERAGAYFALGLAKTSGRPVAVVTTSGTAAANLHPAVVEAHHARVPLILLTADRPPELRDCGAAQTIDQIRLFGPAVRWFHEVGAPDGDPALGPYVAGLARRAAREAFGPPAGPVHLNLAFREPLVPDPDTLPPRRDEGVSPDAGTALPDPVAPPPRAIQRVARLLRTRRRGLIVCGPEAGAGLADSVARLALVTGYPILADPASQVRYGRHDRTRVLGAYDGFLRAPSFAERHAPEVILQFGAPLTSKAFHLYAARHPDSLRVIVDDGDAARDPAHRATESLASDAATAAEALADALAKGADPLPSWGEPFLRAEAAARDAVQRHLARTPGISEGSAVALLAEAAPEGTLLYMGNSMPIRDLDFFVPASPKRLRVLANRGANGIDGVLSSALGASAAGPDPVLAVVGDLSFHHDMNGLVAARARGVSATIVIVNNDGGGIFSFLPIARHGDAFERLVATPHGLRFEHAAALYGIPYEAPASADELAAAARDSLERRETRVLEISSDRVRNRADHEALWSLVIAAVDGRAAP